MSIVNIQAIWEKLQEIDLIPFYKDANFQELMYMVYVFGFVPVDKILEYYERSSFRGLRIRPVWRPIRTGILWMMRTWRTTPADDVYA
jgi:hypothetical protein